MFLGACAQQGGNPGDGTPGATTFAVGVASEIEAVRGDPAGTFMSVTVTFGAAYGERVLLRSGQTTSGLSILYQGIALNTHNLTLATSTTVDLRVIASAAAQDTNAFFVLIAQGITEQGKTNGLPKNDRTIRVKFRQP